jgi:FtsZ-binding cell division protein ZapB
LKKELQKAMEESKAKEAKSKSTIDRLNKQVEELKTKNKELSDEIKHME